MIRLSPVYAPALALIHAQCFTVPWSERDMAETLAMPGAFGFLAGEGEPEGFVLSRVAADEAEILTLAVLPSLRRKGRGGELLDTAMAEAVNRGATRMFLEVDVENIAARRLYEGSGFYTVGSRPFYYGKADALVLRSDLVRNSAG